MDLAQFRIQGIDNKGCEVEKFCDYEGPEREEHAEFVQLSIVESVPNYQEEHLCEIVITSDVAEVLCLKLDELLKITHNKYMHLATNEVDKVEGEADLNFIYRQIFINWVCALGGEDRLAKKLGIRRETIWKYKTGKLALPLLLIEFMKQSERESGLREKIAIKNRRIADQERQLNKLRSELANV